jgi:FkbM family methyltransferase
MDSSVILEPIPRTFGERAHRFFSCPTLVKCLMIARRFPRLFPRIPVPVKLFLGQWWLAEHSALDHAIVSGGFEAAESLFVRNFLRPGATVLDVGAHHGFYTLLASKCVGVTGRVIAFEPSPRERDRLHKHIRLNACANVRIETFALGSGECETDLFLVDGIEDWCNSLRPPAVDAGITRVRVRVKPLDDFVDEARLASVDFVKLDVEGAELDAIKGATKLLTSKGRPVLMVEVYDQRTEPWGYKACEIVQYLATLGYEWYQLDVDGRLESIATDRPTYDANLIAVPAERPLALPNRPKSTAHNREKEVELVC